MPENPAKSIFEQTEKHEKEDTPALVDRLDHGTSIGTAGSAVLKEVSGKLLESGIMPALDKSQLPAVIGEAATNLNHTNISIPGDNGLSSASAVSTVLKAAGANVEQTMNIADLHSQLAKQGWTETPYKPGDQLKPGDVLFTSMDPNRRNVGIVGTDGQTVYSHNFRDKQFVGLTNWSSQFVTVMRAPEK